MINKRIISALCILFLAQISSAQKNEKKEEMNAIFDSKNAKINGFGGPILNFSSVTNDFGLFTGGKGGIIINHNTIFGVEGYQLVTDISHKEESNKDLNFIYGGVFGGYIFNWKSRIHLNTTVMVGWGGIGKREKQDSDEYFDVSENLFVLQPGLELEFNIFKIFRIGLGVNYRQVSEINIESYSNDDLSSFGGVFSLKFGQF